MGVCFSSRADIGFSVSYLFLSAISVCLHAVGRSDTKIPNRTTLLHCVNCDGVNPRFAKQKINR